MITKVVARKARAYFKVTEAYIKQMTTKYGEKLTCENCDKELKEGEWILSKPTGGGKGSIKKAKRYCEDCRKKLNIWKPLKNIVVVKKLIRKKKKQ